MLLYYITDRKQFPGDPAEQRRRLLSKIAEAAHAGVNFIQLREKDLLIRDLEQLAREAVAIVARVNSERTSQQRTCLLMNSRADVAISAGADGVHLTSSDISASEARALCALSCPSRTPVIAVSCHSPAEIQCAASHGADFAVFAPIFGKVQTGVPGVGLSALRNATGQATAPDLRVEAGDSRVSLPVFALGCVTVENAASCVEAGAVGIAGIRIFQDADIPATIAALASTTNANTR